MQDYSPEMLREADRAADEAARDARAEVLDAATVEEATRSPKRSKRRVAKQAAESKSDEQWHSFVIDVWLTNFNPTEFGVFRRSRNRAKSRQFTTDMDVFAEIIEDGKRTGLLGYRKDLWTKNEKTDRRLVFKMFTDKMNWRATMDLMMARSVQQTIGANLLPVCTYSINTSGEDQVVYVERSANKWPLMPETFSFFIIENGTLEFYRIRQKFIRFGDDYLVYNGQGDKIGLLDGAALSIAGKWRCRLRKDYAARPLLNVLKMFTGMLVFNDTCRSHIKKCAKEVRRGTYTPKLEKQEKDLYMNPRRVR